MITNRHLQTVAPTIFMVLVFLAGCRSATTPVEFYTLSPLASVSEADKVSGLGNNIAVGVGPLQIPKIIDRPQIVTRIGPNKINVDEFKGKRSLKNYFELKPSKFFDRFYEGGDIFKGCKIDVVGRCQQQTLRS